MLAAKRCIFRRRWSFRLLAGTMLPLLVLVALEVGLRLGGFGFSTSFFKPLRMGDKAMLVQNDRFGFRFFPPEVARLPRPLLLEASKPSDVFRIFIFGESAAEGDPDPAYGPSRFMEVLLRERFPDQKFEFINVAVTANNSHGILPIARECSRLHGDLWVIYMGNNEMIGPFGASGVFGRPTPPLTLIRLNLALKATRLGQLLSACVNGVIRPSASLSEWGGLGMFAAHHVKPNDPCKVRVYRNFDRNLHDILRIGEKSGAKIILNTVAVNLKDCPPLAAETASPLAPAARASYDRLVTAGKAAEGQGNGATAAKLFEQAVALDPLDADLQYRWGKCLLQMTNLAAARTHFQLACDNDAVPARTDSHLNWLISQEAQRFAGGSLALLEAPDVLAADSAAGICGSETFFEHVHFNPNGSYRLGRAWAERAAGFLPDGHPAAPWFSEEKCERRLAMTDWNRRNDLNEMVNRRHAAPLNAQSNNAQQLAELEQTLVALSKRLDADGVSQARQICLESIQRRPQDLDLHGNYADFLEAIGSFQEAAEQWQLVQQLRPDYYLGYFQAGRMLERLGQLESARDAFQQTVLRRPTMGPAWFELGNIDASLGHWDDALQEVECASRWQSHLPAYYACMGKILARLNRHPEAVARYRQALQADDNYWDGHIALGGELAGAGDWLAAQTEFAAGVRLRPDSVVAHLELGAALASQSQQAAAQREMTQVLQLDPSNQTAQAWLTRWHRN